MGKFCWIEIYAYCLYIWWKEQCLNTEHCVKINFICIEKLSVLLWEPPTGSKCYSGLVYTSSRGLKTNLCQKSEFGDGPNTLNIFNSLLFIEAQQVSKGFKVGYQYNPVYLIETKTTQYWSQMVLWSLNLC